MEESKLYSSDFIFMTILIFLLSITIINFIYQNKKYKNYKSNDLKIIYIDLYNPNNNFEYKIGIEKLEEVLVKIREGMVLYGIKFGIENNINTLSIIEISKKDVSNSNVYNNYNQLKIVCLDGKERTVIVY